MTVEDVDLPAGMEDSLEVYNRLQMFEGARCLGPDFDSHPDLLSVDARALRDHGMSVDFGGYLDALRRYHEWRAATDEAFAGFDAVLTPSAAGEAPAGSASPATSRSTTCGPRSTCRPSPSPPSPARRGSLSGRNSSPPATPTIGCSASRPGSRSSSPDAAGPGPARPPPRLVAPRGL